MSRDDAERWNVRYTAGAYAERTHPSRLLADWLGRIEPGPALDVACGAGRNALYLAGNRFAVTGIDVSGAALARARASAGERGVTVDWREADLADGLPPGLPPFRLIAMIRYVNLPLIPALCERLIPGGWLLIEQHLETDAEVIGPQDPRFRVRPGALHAAVAGVTDEWSFEGRTRDPDGRPVALAQLIARRPP